MDIATITATATAEEITDKFIAFAAAESPDRGFCRLAKQVS